MRRAAVSAAGLVCLASMSLAQTSSLPDFDGHAREGIRAVYNLEFEEAEKEFQTIVQAQPHHPAGHFFLAMVTWWRIMLDLDDERYDREFFSSLDRVIEMCDSMLEEDEDDVTAMFFKGGALGYQGRLHFHRNDYLAAARAAVEALPLVQAASELAPDNYDINLGTGIYNYYADVIPREYPLVKPLLLFIPAGDKAKGIAQLTLASEKAKYAPVEASYFLMQVYYFYEKEYGSALGLARGLHERFPQNVVFHRYVGRCYVSLSNWDAVREVFGEISRRSRAGQRGYGAGAEREAAYYLGVDRMGRGDLEGALQHLYRCDELSRGLDRKEPSGFMAMANLKIGMIYDLQKKRDLAIRQYAKVEDMKEYSDSHALAERYTKRPYGE